MLTGKDLAIKVADRLKEPIRVTNKEWIADCYGKNWLIKNYLHQKAADILFSEGMAERIYNYLYETCEGDERAILYENILKFYRTITPEKLLNVWLRLGG